MSAVLADLPFRIGYGTNGFGDHPLSSAVDVLAHEGYRALALTIGFPHLDPFSSEALREARTLRARCDELDWAVVVETGTRYLLDAHRKHAPSLLEARGGPRMHYLERCVDIAAVLEADCVSFFSGVLPAGAGPAEARERLVERCAVLCDRAAALGVPLAIEPEPGMLVQTVDDALALLAELGDPPGMGVTVDIGHCVVVEPRGVVGALRAAGDRLRNVQLDDMLPTAHEHLPFGEGVVDLAAALRTLRELDYRGVAAIELPRHSHDAPGLARRSAQAALRAWEAVRQEEQEHQHA